MTNNPFVVEVFNRDRFSYCILGCVVPKDGLWFKNNDSGTVESVCTAITKASYVESGVACEHHFWGRVGTEGPRLEL